MNVPRWLDWSDEAIASCNKDARLYKYTYGVKDIQVNYKDFARTSVFVSKPYTIDGNIIEVSLITDEKNYSTYGSRGSNPYDTSVEYYISFHEHPSFDEWKPILPKGQSHIPNEYLHTKNANKARLRFIRDTGKEMSVYKNGVRLSNEFWSYCSDNSVVIDKYYDKYAVYTASYYPDGLGESPWDIELGADDREIVPYIGVDGTEGEVFDKGTDRNGSVILSKYPYIDYSRINLGDATYNPINVSLENAKIAGPNRNVYSIITKDTTPATRNVTDYKNLSVVNLKPYDPSLVGNQVSYPYFDYIQDGRKLYFTETFNNSNIISNMTTNHGDAWIRVKYEYIKSQFRFKAILRNTSPKTSSVTPSVSSYSLVFKVMR